MKNNNTKILNKIKIFAKNELKANYGITLIALIITIIVLLILAGVTLNMVMGENGIIKKANTANEETNRQSATEKLNLKITNAQITSYATKQRMPTLQELADELDRDDEIEYVKKKNVEVGSLAKINIGDATSILTKLKDYKYVFEINNKFQLASITDYVQTKNKVSRYSAAVGKNAYDGNEKTLFPGGNVKNTYMAVDSSAWGKKLLIKYDTSYKSYCFYNSSGEELISGDFRDNTKILDIPKDATKLRLYFNEGGGIYEMYVQD